MRNKHDARAVFQRALRRNRREGQSILEFALIFPIALLVITGLIVFGQILQAWLILHNATRESARVAIVGAPNTEVEGILRDRLYTLDRSQLTFSLDPPQEEQRRVGDLFKVTARYGVRLWIPIYSMVLPNPYPLLSVTTMRIEGLPGVREPEPPEPPCPPEPPKPPKPPDQFCPGDFWTQTRCGWTIDPWGNNPGAVLKAHFDRVFPEGMEIGSGYQVRLTSVDAVRTLLKDEGPPGMLTNNATNPTSTSAGVLMGNVMALTLNVAFSEAGALPQKDPLPVGDLILVKGPFAGQTVAALLQLAHQVIGGDPSGLNPFDADLNDLNDTIANVNENFLEGWVSRGYLRRP
jgi:hypothetical protein